MNEFKKSDLFSLSDQIIILVVATALLTISYFVLKKLKPFILRSVQPNACRRINVIESRYVAKIGYVSIMRVDHQEFLIVTTRSTACLSPLKKADGSLPLHSDT